MQALARLCHGPHTMVPAEEKWKANSRKEIKLKTNGSKEKTFHGVSHEWFGRLLLAANMYGSILLATATAQTKLVTAAFLVTLAARRLLTAPLSSTMQPWTALGITFIGVGLQRGESLLMAAQLGLDVC